MELLNFIRTGCVRWAKGQPDTWESLKCETSQRCTHSFKYCYRFGSYKHRNVHKFPFVLFPSRKGKGKIQFIIICIVLYNLFLIGEYSHFGQAFVKTQYTTYNFIHLTTGLVVHRIVSGSLWLCFKPCLSFTTHIPPVPSAERNIGGLFYHFLTNITSIIILWQTSLYE